MYIWGRNISLIVRTETHWGRVECNQNWHDLAQLKVLATPLIITVLPTKLTIESDQECGIYMIYLIYSHIRRSPSWLCCQNLTLGPNKWLHWCQCRIVTTWYIFLSHNTIISAPVWRDFIVQYNEVQFRVLYKDSCEGPISQSPHTLSRHQKQDFVVCIFILQMGGPWWFKFS